MTNINSNNVDEGERDMITNKTKRRNKKEKNRS